uniref:Theileria-specific sub-telomeric protein, SVSP family, putative n=1 Tax=Theileria annulata TaxID=5874 RepID=A0A3B0MEY0_THEAN
MNKCVIYTYIIILILIGYSRCSDKHTDQYLDGQLDDEDDNFDVRVKELENLLDEEDNYDLIEANIESIIEDDDISSGAVDIETGFQHPPHQTYQPPQLHYEPYQQYYAGYPPVPYPPYQPHPGYQPQPTPQYGPYVPYQSYYPEPHQPYGPYQPQPVPIDEGIQESIDEPQYVEKQRKKPKKKKYKSILFLKKDQDGKLVEMDSEDCKMAFSDSFKSKFIIKGKLEEIFFEGETVWKHMDGNDYPSFVAYNKIIKKFLIFVGQRFFLSRKVSDTWKISSRKVPKYLRMFTKDDEGNDVKITDNQYDFEVTQRGEVIYKIVPGVKCNKIMINEKSIYINRFNKGFPLSVYLNLEGELIVEFKNCTILFKIIDGDYRPLITKRR